MVKQLTLYSDFNCPFCFAMENRLDGLPAEIRQDLTVEWRGIEHSPGLPVPMSSTRGQASLALAQECKAVERAMPGLGLTPPPGKPNTGAAILAVASAAAEHPEEAGVLRRMLYPAFWQDGRDLSDPGLLAELSKTAGPWQSRPTAEGKAMVEQWRGQWEAFGVLAVPLLVGDDGRLMPGLVSEDQLLEFITSA